MIKSNLWALSLELPKEMSRLAFLPDDELNYLWPVVAAGIGKDLAVTVKSATGDGLVHCIRRLQLRPCILIPETVATIGSNSCKRPVDWMEFDIIHLWGIYNYNFETPSLLTQLKVGTEAIHWEIGMVGLMYVLHLRGKYPGIHYSSHWICDTWM